LLQTLEQIGKLTGELGRISTSNTVIHNNTLVINSPIFARIQGAILSALAPFPEARVAVISALRSIETDDTVMGDTKMLEAPNPAEVHHVAA
jgi:hypothetical protein